AEKILGAVNAAPVITQRGPIYATVSIGSASFPDQGLTSYDVITRAESALGDAKRAGRDCHSHYRMTGEQRERQRRSLTISEEVRAAPCRVQRRARRFWRRPHLAAPPAEPRRRYRQDRRLIHHQSCWQPGESSVSASPARTGQGVWLLYRRRMRRHRGRRGDLAP